MFIILNRMNIVIGLCHVDFSNIDTYSESYLKQIVACEIISISSSAMCVHYTSNYFFLFTKF